ncbi:MAG: hypothetical protein P8169_06525, partial [Chloroflexota bacterium]
LHNVSRETLCARLFLWVSFNIHGHCNDWQSAPPFDPMQRCFPGNIAALRERPISLKYAQFGRCPTAR